MVEFLSTFLANSDVADQISLTSVALVGIGVNVCGELVLYFRQATCVCEIDDRRRWPGILGDAAGSTGRCLITSLFARNAVTE